MPLIAVHLLNPSVQHLLMPHNSNNSNNSNNDLDTPAAGPADNAPTQPGTPVTAAETGIPVNGLTPAVALSAPHRQILIDESLWMRLRCAMLVAWTAISRPQAAIGTVERQVIEPHRRFSGRGIMPLFDTWSGGWTTLLIYTIIASILYTLSLVLVAPRNWWLWTAYEPVPASTLVFWAAIAVGLAWLVFGLGLVLLCRRHVLLIAHACLVTMSWGATAHLAIATGNLAMWGFERATSTATTTTTTTTTTASAAGTATAGTTAPPAPASGYDISSSIFEHPWSIEPPVPAAGSDAGLPHGLPSSPEIATASTPRPCISAAAEPVHCQFSVVHWYPVAERLHRSEVPQQWTHAHHAHAQARERLYNTSSSVSIISSSNPSSDVHHNGLLDVTRDCRVIHHPTLADVIATPAPTASPVLMSANRSSMIVITTAMSALTAADPTSFAATGPASISVPLPIPTPNPTPAPATTSDSDSDSGASTRITTSSSSSSSSRIDDGENSSSDRGNTSDG
ncbi:MAG: hypothetical protein ACOC0P_03040, partial [Planctomycetota bacterium]